MRNIQAKITNLSLTDRRFQKVTTIQSSSTPHLLSPLDMDHWPIDMTKFGEEFFSSEETWESPQHEKEHPLPNLHLLGSIPWFSAIWIYNLDGNCRVVSWADLSSVHLLSLHQRWIFFGALIRWHFWNEHPLKSRVLSICLNQVRQV